MQHFDIAIIGSGIAGTSLGAILARHGLRAVIFEAGSHPRFAIGESLILETSETMRAMADLYDVPELAYFSSENFLPFSGSTHGVKRHFGFLHHTAREFHDPSQTLQAVIPKEPHGHEFHLYRQDTDYFMMSTAVSYGATVLQNSPVTAVNFQPDRVEIQTATNAIAADYVVDAGGYRSILAQQFDLRRYELETQSRALFTHMVGVPAFSPNEKNYDLPYRMDEGTLHHIFDGGWLWVIPFDNHPASTNPLCSVGLLLDPRQHPLPEKLSPEEEFRAFIAQYPTIAAQFGGATAVRDWVRTPGRIQYSSAQVVGEQWALLGHAVGFVDPFYSKGLYASLAAVNLLADLLLKAQKSGDYSRQSFLSLETMSFNFLNTADRLVANSYRSFKNHKLWQVYAVMWLLGAYTELVQLNMMRARWGAGASQGNNRAAYMERLATLKIVGGGFPEFDAIADKVDTIMEGVDAMDEGAVDTAVAQINAIFAEVEWMADPFRALLKGATSLPKNKLRLSLLKPNEGFMGKGAYRQHFFGAMSLSEAIRYALREKARFSRANLSRQHKKKFDA